MINIHLATDCAPYVVENENTLGYLCYRSEESGILWMGILHASVLRGSTHSSFDGPIPITFSNIRPATVADFKAYFVQVPSHFDEIQNTALVLYHSKVDK